MREPDGSRRNTLVRGFNAYPEKFSDRRRAEILLGWVERWVLPEDWTRLAGRVRKRWERNRTTAISAVPSAFGFGSDIDWVKERRKFRESLVERAKN